MNRSGLNEPFLPPRAAGRGTVEPPAGVHAHEPQSLACARLSDGEAPTRVRSEVEAVGVMGTSSGTRLDNRVADPPRPVRDARRELAAGLLRGSRVEIGPPHLPMLLPTGVRFRYVDRMTVPGLRAHYPELDGQDLAPVDVVDDRERC